MNHNLNLFARLLKVDEEKRLVYGRAVAEEPDHANEVFDYEKSKPHFQAWSEGFSKSTDGKSVGNLRAMHGKTAAGKLNEITFVDAEKAIDVCAEVVDDNEWKKVLKGVYTGFSIGGKYVGSKIDDPVHKGCKRYEAKPTELSLVDAPCVPSATFSMVKADGTTADCSFNKALTNADIDMEGETPFAKWAQELAEKQKEPAVQKAVRDLHVLLNKPLEKGLWTVSSLARMLSDLFSLQSDVKWEADYEGDNSPLPQMMRDAAAKLSETLIAMATEETQEALNMASKSKPDGDLQKMADSLNTLSKAGARNSKKDLEMLQQIHDHAGKLGAACSSAEKSQNGDNLAKALVDVEKLNKEVAVHRAFGENVAKALGLKEGDDAVAAITKLKTDSEELAKGVEALIKERDKLKSLAAPAKGVVKVVGKADDAGSADDPSGKVAPVTKSDGKVDEVSTLIKGVHAQGGRPAVPLQ